MVGCFVGDYLCFLFCFLGSVSVVYTMVWCFVIMLFDY